MVGVSDTTIRVTCPRCGRQVSAHVKVRSVKVTKVGINQASGLLTTFEDASNIHDCTPEES